MGFSEVRCRDKWPPKCASAAKSSTVLQKTTLDLVNFILSGMVASQKFDCLQWKKHQTNCLFHFFLTDKGMLGQLALVQGTSRFNAIVTVKLPSVGRRLVM
uniref:Uncharacterized protein n=1 Tax=Fibrocapsa japonica TaxID=94617 RepID=A0A7S2V2Y2_9STRA|mmetsp:Transcript_23427/g.34048  ORF Transcript_23427/g.34048 Transcript_23427/m.34048 type:complete len:101 (+) Transcript_23427:29-331(+)